jgi:hypothetical protein
VWYQLHGQRVYLLYFRSFENLIYFNVTIKSAIPLSISFKKNALFVLCFFAVFFAVSQTDTNYVLNFNFNEREIKEADNKVVIKPVGVSLTDDRFGNKKAALFLHGHAESYLNLGVSQLLKPKTGSISLWVKLDRRIYSGKGYDSNPILQTKNGPGDDFILAYSLTYDCYTKRFVSISTKDSTKEAFICSLDEGQFNQWYHLVTTYDDNYLAFYINGKLQQKYRKGFETMFLKTDSVMVGNTASKKNDRWSQGTVDDIQIFHKVLNENEVRALYEAPNPNRFTIIRDTILKYSAIVLCIVFISFLFVMVYRRRLKREEEKFKLNSKLYEMEIKLIKSQMNPHFIFNSLNSIQQLFTLDEKEKAQYYLSNFSRLMRKLLENTTKENLSLADEVEILNRYLEIESLRFNHVFKYTIKIDPQINALATFIPHFLIQPFVENAIWHGLLAKKGDKNLLIQFKLVNENKIECTIDDDGVGRQAKKQNIEKKSLAINFIKQRLELMNKNLGTNLSLTITDKVDANGKSQGTTVILYLPIIKNTNAD